MSRTFTLSVKENGEIDLNEESFNDFYDSAKLEFINLFNTQISGYDPDNKKFFIYIINSIYIRKDMQNFIINKTNYYNILLIYFFETFKGREDLVDFLLEYKSFYLNPNSLNYLIIYITEGIEPNIKTIIYDNTYIFIPKLIHLLATIKYFKINDKNKLIFNFIYLDKIFKLIDISNFKVDFIKTTTRVNEIVSKYFKVHITINCKFANNKTFFYVLSQQLSNPKKFFIIDDVDKNLSKIISVIMENKTKAVFDDFIEEVLDYETKQKVLNHFKVKDILKIIIYI